MGDYNSKYGPCSRETVTVNPTGDGSNTLKNHSERLTRNKGINCVHELRNAGLISKTPEDMESGHVATSKKNSTETRLELKPGKQNFANIYNPKILR